MNKKLIIYFILLISLFKLYLLFKDQFTIKYFLEIKDYLKSEIQLNLFKSVLIYIFGYITLMIISFPVAALLSILGGVFFGTSGIIYSMLAATIGAYLSIKVNQYFLQDFINQKFPDEISKMKHFMEKNSKLALFTLRFSPIFPFYLVNLLLSVVEFKIWDYFIYTTLGKIPLIIMFNFLGQNIGRLSEFNQSDAIPFLIGMALLSLIPWIFKYYINKKLNLEN